MRRAYPGTAIAVRSDDGGTIEISSQLGKGIAVSIRLPRAVKAPAAA